MNFTRADEGVRELRPPDSRCQNLIRFHVNLQFTLSGGSLLLLQGNRSDVEGSE